MDLILLDIIEDTVVDGSGVRTIVYAAGCRHQCPECHNPQSWDVANGYAIAVEKVVEQLLADLFYLVFRLMGQFAETEVRSARGRADAIVRTADYLFVLSRHPSSASKFSRLSIPKFVNRVHFLY